MFGFSLGGMDDTYMYAAIAAAKIILGLCVHYPFIKVIFFLRKNTFELSVRLVGLHHYLLYIRAKKWGKQKQQQ